MTQAFFSCMCKATTQRRGNSKAFTLIELLICVAIITVLIALLLPTLGRARDQAITVKCGSYMRSAGQAINLFASLHEGRGPGGGSGDGIVMNGSVAWTTPLNADAGSLVARWGIGSSKVATCASPDAHGTAGQLRRWVINGNICANSPTNLDVFGRTVHYNGRDFFGSALPIGYATYWDGALLNRFERPSYKIAIVEAESGSDTAGETSPSGIITMGTNPDWISAGAKFAFRHNGYKQANFLFLDTHVETLGPKDGVALDNHYSFAN